MEAIVGTKKQNLLNSVTNFVTRIVKNLPEVTEKKRTITVVIKDILNKKVILLGQVDGEENDDFLYETIVKMDRLLSLGQISLNILNNNNFCILKYRDERSQEEIIIGIHVEIKEKEIYKPEDISGVGLFLIQQLFKISIKEISTNLNKKGFLKPYFLEDKKSYIYKILQGN